MTHAPQSPDPNHRRNGHRRSARSWLGAALLLALGGAGAWQAGEAGAIWIEDRAGTAAREALAQGGFDWAHLSVDGLRLRLTGQAPDAVAQVRALTAVAGRLPYVQVRDDTSLPAPARTAPAFRLEILRNGQEVSAAGLAPDSLDPAAIAGRLGKLVGGDARTELIERTDQPAPAGWDAAVAFAVDAAGQAPRAKLSVKPGQVAITAIADGERDKARLESALRGAVPEGVTLTLDISAPRPAIVPFALALTRANGTTGAGVCAADSEDAQRRIRAALGAPAADCPVGAGAPSPRWSDAAVATIEALGTLPDGWAAIRDTEVSLGAPASVPAPALVAARARLTGALPPGFTLTPDEGTSGEAAAPTRFEALADDNGIHLRGVVSDERVRTALDSLAHTRFGQVDSALTVNPAAPAGWTVRLIGAVETLGALHAGSAVVTPDELRITGDTDDPAAGQTLAAELARRTGPGVPYRLALRYDPALQVAAGEACAARLNGALALAGPALEQGGAADPAPAMAALAETARGCAGHRFSIVAQAGDEDIDAAATDEARARADAVIGAMRRAGIDTANLTIETASAPEPDEGQAAKDGTGPDSEGDGDQIVDDDAAARGPSMGFRLVPPEPGPARPLEVLSGVTAALPPQDGATDAPRTMPRIGQLSGPPPALTAGPGAAAAPAGPTGPEAAADPAALSGGHGAAGASGTAGTPQGAEAGAPPGLAAIADVPVPAPADVPAAEDAASKDAPGQRGADARPQPRPDTRPVRP